MIERNISVFTLIGYPAMMESYYLCKDIYANGFHTRMASMTETIMDLQEESEKPGGVTFNEAAFLMLITPCPEFGEEDNKILNHTIRAAIVWHSLELPDIKKAMHGLGM